MRMSGGNDKEPPARIKMINCDSLPHAPRRLSMTSKKAHFGYGRGPTRLTRLVRREPSATNGTILKFTWSTTSALLESITAIAADDWDSVVATSANDESGNAWSEDI